MDDESIKEFFSNKNASSKNDSASVHLNNYFRKINPAVVLSWSLALVVFYFGFNEIVSPQNWIAFVPGFLGNSQFTASLVIFHGILLFICGLALILNFYRKIAAAVIFLMLLEIVINLIGQSGFSDIAVRDIGLLGAALTLLFIKD